MAAVSVCEQLGISSQENPAAVENAKKTVYKKGFYDGVGATILASLSNNPNQHLLFPDHARRKIQGVEDKVFQKACRIRYDRVGACAAISGTAKETATLSLNDICLVIKHGDFHRFYSTLSCISCILLFTLIILCLWDR